MHDLKETKIEECGCCGSGDVEGVSYTFDGPPFNRPPEIRERCLFCHETLLGPIAESSHPNARLAGAISAAFNIMLKKLSP